MNEEAEKKTIENRAENNESIVRLRLGIKQKRPEAISCLLRLEIPLLHQTHAPRLPVQTLCVHIRHEHSDSADNDRLSHLLLPHTQSHT